MVEPKDFSTKKNKKQTLLKVFGDNLLSQKKLIIHDWQITIASANQLILKFIQVTNVLNYRLKKMVMYLMVAIFVMII